MRLYDSHCHLDFEAFDEDLEAVMERARRAGVRAVLVPAFEPERWERLARLRALYPEVRIAIGVHPHAIATPAELAGLEEALVERASALGAVAIGECGLDARTARAGGAALPTQRAVLDAHLAAARALQLPIVLHAVHAHGALLEALAAAGPLPRGGVLHGFTGPAELVQRYVGLGLCFGLGAAITRPRARRAAEAARVIPEERLLVETDAPEMAAHGRNEPARVTEVVAALAHLRAEPEEWVAERTFENATRLFGAR